MWFKTESSWELEPSDFLKDIEFLDRLSDPQLLEMSLIHTDGFIYWDCPLSVQSQYISVIQNWLYNVGGNALTFGYPWTEETTIYPALCSVLSDEH
jgi:hypothetical protein